MPGRLWGNPRLRTAPPFGIFSPPLRHTDCGLSEETTAPPEFGFNPCARQIRRTLDSLNPVALAMLRVLQ